LERWFIERNFKGFDPHDALRGRIVRTLTFHNVAHEFVQLYEQLGSGQAAHDVASRSDVEVNGF
jgi:hypothetical protein